MREIDTIDNRFKEINRKTLLGWVVWYYINGELVKYTSEEHDWIDLPKIGVQYMYRIYDTHKEQWCGSDMYCPYQLMYIDVKPYIKYGLYIDDKIFNEYVVPNVINDSINF